MVNSRRDEFNVDTSPSRLALKREALWSSTRVKQSGNSSKACAKQVKIWRRSYDISPPPVETTDDRHPKNDLRYQNLVAGALPATESLKTTLERVQPYWEDHIIPQLKLGRNVLITAHGNSLRALVKILESISDEQITEFNIPTGIPRIYELDSNLRPLRAEYLGNSETITAATKIVADQATV